MSAKTAHLFHRSPLPVHRSPVFSRRGGAVLEAALVLPVLLSLAFGTVEVGYYFYVEHSLLGAARDGARAAIVAGAQYTDIATAVSNSLSVSRITAYTITVQDLTTNTPINGANFANIGTGDAVSVSVQATWGTAGATFRPLGLISASKQVTGTVVMRNEG